MINNLHISYEQDRNYSISLTTETCADSNLPFNLAAVFGRIIRDSEANADLVVEYLKNEFEYE